MIMITDKMAVQKDGDCWAIAEKRVPKKGPQAGETVWTNRAWFVRLSDACIRALEISLKPRKGSDIDALIASIKVTEDRIREQVKAMGEK
jgi:hypothetical protein